MKPHEFWNLTYAEFIDMVESYKRIHKKRINEFLYTAWHTAVLSRIKEIPPLINLMQETGDKREQTDDDMLAMTKILNAAFGGEIKEV